MRNVKSVFIGKAWPGLLATLCVLATGVAAFGFPPAPYHTLYGMVRDEMGEPLMADNAVVILETATGAKISTSVVPFLAPGMNYRLQVPMDAGLTSATYKPTALKPAASFRMKVIAGGITYLPMEMTLSAASLGKPAQSTRVDLTIGEDSDNDGLPDAWERALISMGYGATLADIRPGDDSDGDGLSNMDEYLAGTYAFDSSDCFSLDLVGMQEGRPLIEFMVLPGRNYVVQGSSDLKIWNAVDFRVPVEGAAAAVRQNFPAADVRILRIAAETSTNQPVKFFRVQVQ